MQFTLICSIKLCVKKFCTVCIEMAPRGLTRKHLRARSDTAEIAWRTLAAFVHEKRTRDRDAAVSMLAMRPTNLTQEIPGCCSKANTEKASAHGRGEGCG